MPRIYDISMPISPDMPVYKNRSEKRPVIETIKDFEQGVRESRLHLDCHTGTHLDAPLHVFPGGRGVDSIYLSTLVGHCKVLDLTVVQDRIRAKDISDKNIRSSDFVLCKTKNSFQEITASSFVYLSEDAARYLAALPIRGIGIDALGIERDQPGHPSHKALLGKGIPILEGLRLAEVTEGDYFMVALPLALGTEAAPARVVLWKGDHSSE